MLNCIQGRKFYKYAALKVLSLHIETFLNIERKCIAIYSVVLFDSISTVK